MKISPARVVAAKVLEEIESSPYAQAADLVSQYAQREGLREDDIRLARAIVFGVLRHAPTLDYYYAPFLKQHPQKLHTSLRILLRMATFQQHFLSKIPPYAIVNETVELARLPFRMKAPQVGFLNAVLRKIVAPELVPPPLPAGNRINDLSVRYGFPPDYVRLLVEKYGTHKATAVMAAAKVEPPMTIRVNVLRTTMEELSSALTILGFEVEPGAVAANSLVVTPGATSPSIFDIEEFRNGLFYVQDEASQLVAHIASPQPGEQILDMCAAPGGKTTHMAELAGGKAAITATDISEERLHLVEENLQRLLTPGVTITALENALANDRMYDAVLVDAPCSGAGTVRRNPEIAQRLTPAAFAHHADRQNEVLATAAKHVRPGGRLVYSTCSISEQENKGVVNKFLKEHPEFQIDAGPASTTLEQQFSPDGLRSSEGFYQTWPAYPEIDGFEAVVLRRNETA